MKDKIAFYDKFKRYICVIYSGLNIISITVDGRETLKYTYSSDCRTIILVDKSFTGQPKWWQFWKPEINPTIYINLTGFRTFS